ncbi:hypothetical protein [Marinoscillum sp.]|uniref:hypothetical protein n=1 Tax=Marinoscillum sp. TaxID=2024838 RepID=UPI003BAC75C5
MKVLFNLIILSFLFSCGGSSGSSTYNSYSQPKTKIEDIKIVKEHSNAWAVRGMVRNISSSSIKGAVKIKFLNSNGDILHSHQAYVNDGDPLNPNQAGAFEYFDDPEEFTNVVDFDVEFYER